MFGSSRSPVDGGIEGGSGTAMEGGSKRQIMGNDLYLVYESIPPRFWQYNLNLAESTNSAMNPRNLWVLRKCR